MSDECRKWKERTGQKCIGSRLEVFKGKALKTSGGLRVDDLKLNRYGRIVSVRVSRKSSRLTNWAKCVARARRTLGLSGAVMINGRTQEGKDLYEMACRFCEESGGCPTRNRGNVELHDSGLGGTGYERSRLMQQIEGW